MHSYIKIRRHRLGYKVLPYNWVLSGWDRMRPLGVGRFLFKFNASADIREQAKSDDANARLLQFPVKIAKLSRTRQKTI